MAGSGKNIAWGAVILGLAILTSLGYASRRWFAETWQLHKLASGTEAERTAAASKFGKWKTARAVAPLIETFARDEQRPQYWHYSWAAIIQIGPRGVPYVVPALDSEDEALRWNAAHALGRIGPTSHVATRRLRDLLADDHPLVRREAAGALARIGPAAAESVPALVHLIEQERDAPRPRGFSALSTAAWALGKVDATAAVAAPCLLSLLDHKSEVVRRNAVKSLGRLGSEAAETIVPRLESLLQDEDATVRAAANRSLGKIDAAVKVKRKAAVDELR